MADDSRGDRHRRRRAAMDTDDEADASLLLTYVMTSMSEGVLAA